MSYLNELSLIFLGSGGSLLISAALRESVNRRYGIGALMMVASFVFFVGGA